jgi:transcriptional regulator with XRE-family HTH domain
LAKLLNIDETILSRIINGFREPDSELKSKIANLLACDARWLFDRHEIESSRLVSGPAELPATELEP